MREIKFRVWNKKGNEMIYDIALYSITGYVKLNHYLETSQEEGYFFMQYIGLKDNNGKMIFEGDIVKKGDTLYEIKYKDKWGCFIKKDLYWRNKGDNGEETIIQSECKRIEVIGNIYENKELLNHK